MRLSTEQGALRALLLRRDDFPHRKGRIIMNIVTIAIPLLAFSSYSSLAKENLCDFDDFLVISLKSIWVSERKPKIQKKQLRICFLSNPVGSNYYAISFDGRKPGGWSKANGCQRFPNAPVPRDYVYIFAVSWWVDAFYSLAQDTKGPSLLACGISDQYGHYSSLYSYNPDKPCTSGGRYEVFSAVPINGRNNMFSAEVVNVE